MRGDRISIGAGALLVLALLYYVSSPGEAAALALPVAAHELGHVAAFYLLGLRIEGLSLELKGFCIRYSGYTGALGHAAAALAGPLAGLSYAFAAARLAERLALPWLELSAGLSLLLTLFNLLPALPLDGGRALSALACALMGERAGNTLTESLGLLCGIVLLCAGLWLMTQGRGIGLELAAVWLLLYQDTGQGLVKNREMI